MLQYIQIFIAIILSVLSAKTDYKNQKIYNKYILIAMSTSLVVYCIFLNTIKYEEIGFYCINFAITIIVSFLFYYFKIWAAGDAKLFISIVFMIPFEVYNAKINNYFPALNLLIIVFSVAFIYVFFETIILLLNDENRFKNIKIPNMDIKVVINYLISYVMGFAILTFINNVMIKYFTEMVNNNMGLLMLVNSLILLLIFKFINTNKKMFILTIIFICLDFILGLFSGITIDFKIMLIVILITIFRDISKEYNYKEISIKELKPRMILSLGTTIKFCVSRIKGLPKLSTEGTDSRLTEEEVESIKRWSKSKNGEESVVIVRYLPFAPFILIGEIIFFVFRLFL